MTSHSMIVLDSLYICFISDDEKSSDGLNISAVTGSGLDELKTRLEEAIIKSTGRMRKVFRIPVRGDHLRYIRYISQLNLDLKNKQAFPYLLLFLFSISRKWCAHLKLYQYKTFVIDFFFSIFSWLYKNSTVLSITDGENGDSYLVETIINTAAYGKFKHLFSTNKRKP